MTSRPCTRRRAAAALRRAVVAVAGLAAGLALLPAGSPATAAEPDESGDLYLVTLDGPGTAGLAVSRGPVLAAFSESALRREQARVLALVGSPEPVYTWTTALNGFAVRLDETEADAIAADPGVARVEADAVRPLAGRAVSTVPGSALPASLPAPAPAPGSGGGAGTVIGVVDTGLAPESRLFAAVPRLGRRPAAFDGTCRPGDGWAEGTCNAKVLAAQWFVEGFGPDALASTELLSARDVDGHGTQMASIAAGNAGVPVRVGDDELDTYAGRAPRARLAVYKACWSAPDPGDDGCATSDLVAAVDRATRDGVDVLNLSVGGPPDFDTLELALLGAAEADVVVVAAAGNGGARTAAAHPSPWVTTVGAAAADARRGVVDAGGGLRLRGAMVSTEEVGPARVALGATVRAPGVARGQARTCAPGSLDAGRAAGRIVVCERGGGVGRVVKSRTVALADGVGMVLVNDARGSVAQDFHSVPTVHLDATAGRELVRWAAAHPRGRASLTPAGVSPAEPAVARWSASGSPAGTVAKPDLVAPGTAVLAAVPGSTSSAGPSAGWDFVSGTSPASAYAAGVAATLASRTDLSAAEIRSALATTSRPVPGAGVLRSGAGLLRPSRTATPGLVHPVDAADYRRWLEGRRTRLNTPSVVLDEGARSATRTVVNLGNRALYFSSRTTGFTRDVRVTPAAVRLEPGESATYTVELVDGGPVRRSDDGYVVWRGATGTQTRVPVLVVR